MLSRWYYFGGLKSVCTFLCIIILLILIRSPVPLGTNTQILHCILLVSFLISSVEVEGKENM